MFTGSLLIVTAAVVGLAYYSYVPFPDYASDPWRKSCTSAVGQLQRLAISVGEITGLAEDYQVRRLFVDVTAALAFQTVSEDIQETYTHIDGVGALIQRPKRVKATERSPGLIYIHGGGWISDSAENHRVLTSFLANETGSIVISLDHRLAPEHKFPVPFEDCLKAARYILKHADEFDLDSSKVGIAGDGSGGNLALSVALNMSSADDTSLPQLRVVGVFYAPIQAFDFRLPSYIKHETGPGVQHVDDVLAHTLYYIFGKKEDELLHNFKVNNHTSLEWKLSNYASIFDIHWLPFSFRDAVPSEPTADFGDKVLFEKVKDIILDPRLSPMLAPESLIAKLPPSYFISAEFDPLRDESFMAYARFRKSHVNKFEHVYYRTEQFGFLDEVESNDVAKEALIGFVGYYKQKLEEEVEIDAIEEDNDEDLVLMDNADDNDEPMEAMLSMEDIAAMEASSNEPYDVLE